jgi:hypothetical protein
VAVKRNGLPLKEKTVNKGHPLEISGQAGKENLLDLFLPSIVSR